MIENYHVCENLSDLKCDMIVNSLKLFINVGEKGLTF